MDTLTEAQFHTVWTTAVGMKRYNKFLFRELFEKLKEDGKMVPENVPSKSEGYSADDMLDYARFANPSTAGRESLARWIEHKKG